MPAYSLYLFYFETVLLLYCTPDNSLPRPPKNILTQLLNIPINSQ